MKLYHVFIFKVIIIDLQVTKNLYRFVQRKLSRASIGHSGAMMLKGKRLSALKRLHLV